MVASALWYVLTLIASDFCKLHKLQQMLVFFIWGREERRAQHKAPQCILTLAKSKGGMGLIDVTVQAKACTLSTQISLVLATGISPLLCLIHFEANKVSKQ